MSDKKHTCPRCKGKGYIGTVFDDKCGYCEGMGTFDDMNAIKLLILNYGWQDGEHHKQWILDQTLRIIAGEGYADLIENEFDGQWDEGIAP